MVDLSIAMLVYQRVILMVENGLFIIFPYGAVPSEVLSQCIMTGEYLAP